MKSSWVGGATRIPRIVKLVSDAEDEVAGSAARITSKKALESYAYNLRNSLTDEKLAEKFEPADNTKLESAVNDAIKWLDASQEGSKEEYEEKQKELEAIANLKYVSFWILESWHVTYSVPALQHLQHLRYLKAT